MESNVRADHSTWPESLHSLHCLLSVRQLQLSLYSVLSPLDSLTIPSQVKLNGLKTTHHMMLCKVSFILNFYCIQTVIMYLEISSMQWYISIECEYKIFGASDESKPYEYNSSFLTFDRVIRKCVNERDGKSLIPFFDSDQYWIPWVFGFNTSQCQYSLDLRFFALLSVCAYVCICASDLIGLIIDFIYALHLKLVAKPHFSYFLLISFLNAMHWEVDTPKLIDFNIILYVTMTWHGLICSQFLFYRNY